MDVWWIWGRFWFINPSSCGVYIFFDIIHQHLMAAGGREPAHFFTLVRMHQICHYTGGRERMSWRRYVFLHRIHPHSILIGFSLHRKKRGNRGERRDESWRGGGGENMLLWVSIFTSTAMPPHHRGPRGNYTPTNTHLCTCTPVSP